MVRRLATANAIEETIQKGLIAITNTHNQVKELTQEQPSELVADLENQVNTTEAVLRQMLSEWENVKERYHVGERIIKAQEEAWQRVAREIHDGPAQSLANIVLRAEICERLMMAGRPEIGQELAQLKLLVKESLREVRKIIFDLRPMTLDDLGLLPTLHRYLANLREQNGTPVKLVAQGQERRLSSTLEAGIFRVIQEAVNNARKHAQASQIQVQVVFGETELIVTVSDDGVGFDKEKVKKGWLNRQSFGLMSMRERVELLDGEFDVVSRVGKGTVVHARVPYLPA